MAIQHIKPISQPGSTLASRNFVAKKLTARGWNIQPSEVVDFVAENEAGALHYIDVSASTKDDRVYTELRTKLILKSKISLDHWVFFVPFNFCKITCVKLHVLQYIVDTVYPDRLDVSLPSLTLPTKVIDDIKFQEIT